MIELNFPGTGWLRLDRDVLHALARYQAAHGLTGWDETIDVAAQQGAFGPRQRRETRR